MPHLPGKFVWFEHVSQDVAKASAFYRSLFGWSIDRVTMGDQSYDMIMNGADGLGGLRAGDAGMPSHWASYLSVADVDASFAAAKQAGAQPLLPPTDFGPVGRAAAVSDPTGAAVCLWKGAEGDRPDVDPIPIGDWYWNELWTQDPPRALAFYEKVFGYGRDSMDMGPAGMYYMLNSGDKARAGVFKPSDAKAPPLWVPYVHVADCDASAAKAKQLGAQMIIVPPTDIPGVGRFSVFVDPLGAILGIIRGAPAA